MTVPTAEYVGTPERLLVDRITGNYSTLTRPLRNSTAALDVTLRFSLLAIKEFVRAHTRTHTHTGTLHPQHSLTCAHTHTCMS